MWLDSEFKERNILQAGPISRARWMSIIIYSLKTLLLSNKIKESPIKEFLNDCVLAKIKRFVDFCVKCYIPWWISCSVPAASPRNDLEFLKTLFGYQDTDEVCAKAAITSFSRHLWYLTEELLPLSLFDDCIPVDQKKEIASRFSTSLPQVSLFCYKFTVYIVLLIQIYIIFLVSWYFIERRNRIT